MRVRRRGGGRRGGRDGFTACGELLETRCVLDSTVVFSEVMYHPGPDDVRGEWIELHNQMAADVELSRWTLQGGVEFQFPDGTILPGGGYLVIASRPEAFAGQLLEQPVLGPWQGNLANQGERLELRNHTHRLMNLLEYDDVAPWPVGADGTGASLARIDAPVDASDAENWRASQLPGGTPGAANLPLPPSPLDPLQFSEIAAAGPGFWLELENRGDIPIASAGIILASSAGTRFTLPETLIAPGARWVIGTEMGFEPAVGDRLTLWGGQTTRLLDAVRVENEGRGRADQREGRWQAVSTPTPGAANQFQLHDEIVINEIMYHHRPTYAQAGELVTENVVPIDATWRFDASGQDHGVAWREPHFDDASWPTGAGLFFAETSALPGPKNTPLPLGQPTYYFRTSFELASVDDQLALSLRHVADDGAVFYLNGQEFYRWNMPSGPIGFQTLASASVGNAVSVGPVTIPTGLLRAGQNVLAVEVHQNIVASPDVVFGMEVQAVGQAIGAAEYRASDEEWIELYNRSDQPVDLSGWQFVSGVTFTIPAGTTLGPGEYAVVASDAAWLSEKYPDIRVLGSFSGTLANGGERIVLVDQRNNLADEVRYFDGGYWPEYADGGGTSLELRDPHSDNRAAASWAASDESSRSEWRRYTYTRTVAPIVHDPPINFHEFIVGLLSGGEVLLDNLSVVEDPAGAATELLQNGSFETDTLQGAADKWRIMGTHERSVVVEDPDDPGNQVLHLIADGRKNYLSNHAETTLANGARVVDGRTYQISFDAKWIAGSPQLHTELYYKDAARTTILHQPERSGTPGRVNSTWVANLGPTLTDLQHQPAVPSASQSVEVTVRAADPDGLQAMTLWYAVAGRAPWLSVPMLRQGDGLHHAQLPPQTDNTVVQFYVEATDLRGASTYYPPAGPDSRALYKVDDGFVPDSLRHDFMIVMLPDEVTRLHNAVNMLDNNRLGTTVVYDGRDVFYDTGTRLRGSMFSRNNRASTGYNVEFRPEQLFRGVHDSVAFDQNGENEILVKFATLQSSHWGGTYDDVMQLTTPSGAGGGPTLAYIARHGDLFLSEQFENGDEGTLFKFEGIRVLTSTVDNRPESLKIYQPIGWVANFDIQDLGDDKELYRWPFLINGGRDRDDYAPIIAMAKAFSLSGDNLEAAVSELLDMDTWTHTFALMSLFGIGDAYSQGNPHNLNLYVRPEDNKILAFPWDWDFVFNLAPTAPLHGNQNIGKILDLPQFEHLFLGQMNHLMETVFQRSYMSRWVTHFGNLLGANYASALTSIDNRRQSVTSRFPTRVPFLLGSDGALDSLVPLVAQSAPASALVPTPENGGDLLDLTWTARDFVLSPAWTSGTTGVGFEATPAAFAPLIGLNVSEMMGQNGSVYVRIPFEVTADTDWEQLLLRMRFDDGFVAYLNGERVASANAPDPVQWNSNATTSVQNVNAVKPIDFDLSPWIHLLQPGTNILAIQGMNRTANGNDALLVPELLGLPASDGPPPELSVDTDRVTLEGTGWINVKEIRIAGETDPLPVRWMTSTQWQANVPVSPGRHEWELEAVDFSGRVISRQAVNVTSTWQDPLQEYLRIDEIMYHPADATAAERQAGVTDGEQFEFVEIVNAAPSGSGIQLDLTGVRFAEAFSFTFPSLLLAPQQRVVVARDPAAFAVRYGELPGVVGPFGSGQLNNGGERVLLLAPNDVAILDFAYADAGEWPAAADGSGSSLEWAGTLGAPSADFRLGGNWRGSAQSGGSPGTASRGVPGDFNLDGDTDIVDLDLLCAALDSNDSRYDLNGDARVDTLDLEWMLNQILQARPGDANLDGTFNSRDLVQVFIAGGYEDSVAGNATWSTGDWNCDGDFTTADLVLAFSAGIYSPE